MVVKNKELVLFFGDMQYDLTCNYRPAGKFRMYERNGDPAGPPDPAELEITKLAITIGEYTFPIPDFEKLPEGLREKIETWAEDACIEELET
jgi:hypothetical protein